MALSSMICRLSVLRPRLGVNFRTALFSCNYSTTMASSKKPAATEDEGMDPLQYFNNRMAALAALKRAGVDPYPHKFDVKTYIAKYLKRYECLNDDDHLENVEERIAGRIMNKLSFSQKLMLYDLQWDGATVQVMADARNSDLGEEEFSTFHNSVKLGDIVGIIGFPGKSKMGELSIFPKKVVVLSYCLRMLTQDLDPWTVLSRA